MLTIQWWRPDLRLLCVKTLIHTRTFVAVRRTGGGYDWGKNRTHDLKGLSHHEIDFKNFDKNLQNLT